ncbi:hypothetical protein GON26_13060 [Flavobacterium sp. GA093]|uniref:Uncharacterized protein n=1 Tax=Flavobacterium hydrocarbonoxydans TaxID=2683249 RepID=A0A6I4NME2_9FLAO|nr:hypothetical protein [Flavobacterium hydrocarbonoxydans]MWB95291.1 hypothetical protein [Flavobacterium hydrocarbonoxydans]
MYTTYHLDSAQDINEDILEAIKIAFKSRPITITIEEDEDFELTEEMKKILDERLKEDGSDYISSEESIAQLKSKYGL